jgi:hypothetical protein
VKNAAREPTVIVSGYMSFILIWVAGLACKWWQFDLILTEAGGCFSCYSISLARLRKQTESWLEALQHIYLWACRRARQQRNWDDSLMFTKRTLWQDCAQVHVHIGGSVGSCETWGVGD